MKPINAYYGHHLTKEDIQNRKHRETIGGLWDEIGKLQFDFLTGRGLQPRHRLLDAGCGALRGGVHFVRYLDPGNYYGADLNPSLIEAGRYELQQAGLTNREPHLMVTETFGFKEFGAQFDYALALSLFTHLPADHILRCLVEVAGVLKPGGVFFATFFEAPHPAHMQEITHEPGGIVTRFDSDPYHCSFQELERLAGSAGLRAEFVGNWNHPRAQKMAAFSPA